MPLPTRPLRRLPLLLAAFIAAVLSCGREPTAPGAGAVRYARGLAFRPIFPAAVQQALEQSGGTVQLVPFTTVHVVLHHSDGSVALDTVVDFPPGTDTKTVSLTVALLPGAPAGGEPMTLDLAYIDSHGVTVYSRTGVAVLAAPAIPGQPAPPPVDVPLNYVGPGANATSVLITPRAGSAFTGDPFTFTAVARDGSGTTIPGTPIAWTSLDPTVATVPSVTTGTAVAQTVRGAARIQAQLLTGPSDQVLFTVQLRASVIAALSGSGQSATVGLPLAQPLVAKVTASDGVGVSGVTVTFAATAGGGSMSSATALTDASGLAQATWTLGGTVGTQTASASAAGLSGSPVSFSATGLASAAKKLAVTAQPANTTAGAPVSVVITVQDALNNTATAFTGPVTLAFGANPGVATLGGATTVNAVAGVAAFPALTVNRVGTGYTLVATSSGLTSATTNPFTIAVGPTYKVVFTQSPVSTTAGASLGSVQVSAQDSCGNAATTFAGVVALALGANPGAGALSGGLTATAVAGVATFPGLSVNRPASGYTLVASATGLVSGTSGAFDIALGPPAQLTLASGGGQSAGGNAPLPQPIVVQVSDAGGNALPGAGRTVTFAIVTGGGAVAPASTTTTGAGQASTAWTLGPTVGAQSISAASAGLASLTVTATATTAVAPGPAANLAISGGNGQSGATSTLLATPLSATVTDAVGIPVPAITVNWAAVTGGGSVSAPTSVTNASGIATINWTLGATAGPQTATATVAPLTGSPATFTATATVAGFSKTWAGTSGAGWNTPANWAPAGIPVATDGVFIPVTANNPVLSSAVTVAALTLAPGASLTIGTNNLSVNGNLDAGTTIVGTTGSVNLPAGTTGTLRGFINASLFVNGAFTLVGATTVTGNLGIGGGSPLIVGGQTLTVTGILGTSSLATLQMTNPLDQVNVTGSVSFAGGDETGRLTAGTLTVSGNFTQNPALSFLSFVATSGHTTVLNGSAAQTISMQSPDTLTLSPVCAASCFGNLTINNSGGGVTFATAATARGNLVINNGPVIAIGAAGSPKVVTVAGTTTTAAGAPVHFTRYRTTGNIALGAATTIDSIGFSGTAAQTVAAGTYGEVTFLGSPTITGNITTTGGFTVANGAASSGILAPNGHRINVAGALTTTNGGVLSMSTLADTVVVGGNATFNGGSTAGLLTNGYLEIRGASFTQGVTAQSFSANAPHETVFADVNPAVIQHQITFANASFTNSHFGTLYIQDTLTVLGSDIFADGEFETGTTYHHVTSTAGDRLVTSRGADVNGLRFDNVRWQLLDGAAVNNLTAVEFLNISNTTAVQFEMIRPTITNRTLSFWLFQTTPVAPGLYMRVTGPDTLSMNSVTPASNGGFVATAGFGAILNWTSASSATFTGANVSSTGDWNDPLNWSTGSVPTSVTNVTIPSGTPFPPRTPAGTFQVNDVTVAAGASVQLSAGSLFVLGNLTVASGATINITFATAQLVVNGNVSADPAAATPAVTTCSAFSGLYLAGTLKTVQGKFCNVFVTGTYTLTDSLVSVLTGGTNGFIAISGTSATLTLNGHHAHASKVATAGTGSFTMTNPLDSLVSDSSAAFGGVPGTMTAGNLVLGGDMDVVGSAFDAGGTHTTTMVNATTDQTVTWGTPGTAGFQNLTFRNAGPKWFAQDGTVHGNVLIASTVTSAINVSNWVINIGGNLTDQTSVSGGAWPALETNFTGTPAVIPALLPSTTVRFSGGTTVALPNNVATGSVIVDGAGSRLNLNGHRVTSTTGNFTTQNGGTLQMTTAGDSLDVAGGMYFNGGSTTGLLNRGGIVIHAALFQGFDTVGAVVPGASTTAYAASSGHRTYSSTTGAMSVKFANPGTGAAGSHVASFQPAAVVPVSLGTNMFVDDTLFGGSIGNVSFVSDVLSSAANNRLITTQGIYNPGTSGMTFGNVSVKFVDGMGFSPGYFNTITFNNFPANYTGTVFELARTTVGVYSFTGLNFGTITLSGAGKYIRNTGTQPITGVSGTCTVAIPAAGTCP